jgi:hypothetical protein
VSAAPLLSVNARAILRWVERCGGRTPRSALKAEFIDRRLYWPEDFEGAMTALIESGKVAELEGGTIVISSRELVE